MVEELMVFNGAARERSEWICLVGSTEIETEQNGSDEITLDWELVCGTCADEVKKKNDRITWRALESITEVTTRPHSSRTRS